MNQSDVTCPAGELVHPTASQNDNDILCRADGMVQDAKTAPCVDSLCYVKCPIWKIHKESEWKHKRLGAPEMMLAGRG